MNELIMYTHLIGDLVQIQLNNNSIRIVKNLAN